MKILIGLNNGSDALFNEGIENFTDIIKVIIISLSIKFAKDKIGSIVIIILMLFTGISLAISSIFSLIMNETIKLDFYAFILMLISIILNYLLMFYKSIVGKLAGNFSLLSDAKDNLNNIRISLGVIIGLTFAIFHIYIMDALIGLFISFLIIYDGAITLKELIVSGDEIEIDIFKLKIDEIFENRISYWILITIHEEGLSKEEINNRFIEAVEKGYEIYDIFAIFGFYNIQKNGIIKILNMMEKDELFIQKNKKTHLTNKGISRYYKARAFEFKEISKEYEAYRKERKIGIGPWKCILLIIIIFILIYFGPIINEFLSQL